MASASEACSSLLGLSTTSPGIAFLTGAQHLRCSHYPPRVFSVSCKSRRNRNSSRRRQQLQKVSQGKLPLKEMFRPKVEVSKVQNGTPSDMSSCEEQTVDSDNTNATAFTMADGAQRVNDDDQVPSNQLKDLAGTIKNAEKTQVHALEDLDKILAEKKMLQGQVRSLEMKLEEVDEYITVAKQREEYIKVLEMELQKLKNEISFKEAEVDKYHVHANGRRVVDPEDPAFSLNNFSSLTEELNNLRKENTLLRDNVELLNTKLHNGKETDEHVDLLEEERISLMTSVKELESKLAAAQKDDLGISIVKSECKDLQENVESLQVSLDNATRQANQSANILEQNDELRRKIVTLEASLAEAKEDKFSLEKSKQANEVLQQKIKMLEYHIQLSDQEINSYIQLYQASVKEFQDTLNDIKEKNKKKSSRVAADDMPWEFWSHLLLMVDTWSLEKRISANNANLLREMAWKRDVRIQDAYFTSKGKSDNDVVATFLKLTSPRTSSSLNIVHIAAEMAPIAKVGGLGDVVSGLCKALQRKGNLVEVIVPKYDCLETTHINDLRMLDVVIESFFDGQLFKNNIWVGTVEGLPVYFIDPHHPAKFFQRGQVYGQHDDFKRFSFFSRAALEFLHQAEKRPDIIHCHDWHTAFIAPLYWELYAPKGFNSARLCFTCHNFEYQGTAPASELASCGLNVNKLQRADRMQDNSSHDRVNLVKGATIFSNIVTTVSPTYAKEVQTAEGGRGLHSTLNLHSKKFVGILNGIDSDTWNPSRDALLRFQYSADEFHRKIENKDAIRKYIKLSSANPSQPLVGCVTRLVPQKGVHLIRHAIYHTLELGGQFILLGSSPVHHIQREFEDIANHFESHPHARLILKYDEALSHSIYAALDMLVIPSIFEPCGLTQMIAMRYGTVPIVRRTGGLNDSVFDVDDNTIPVQLKNGFTFLSADERGLSNALERAFNLYTKSPKRWWQLVQKNMRADFSWDSSSSHYEDLYQKAVARARAAV